MRFISALFLLLLSASISLATDNTIRSFPAGNVTDRVETATFTLPQKWSLALTFKPTSYSATGNVYVDDDLTFATNSNGTLLQIGAGWTTTNGQWTAPLPSAGAKHSVLLTYDGSSTSNAPKLWVDAVSQTVTLLTTPVGTYPAGTQLFTIGNANGGTLGSNASICCVGLWNVNTLGSTEATRLNNSEPPCALLNFTGNLIDYWPVSNGESPEPDIIGTHPGTVTGSSTTTGFNVLNTKCLSRTMTGAGR